MDDAVVVMNEQHTLQRETMRNSKREAQRHALIGRIYSAGADPKMWRPVMAEMAEYLGCSSGYMATHDLQSGRGVILHCVGIDPQLAARYRTISWNATQWFARLQSRCQIGAPHHEHNGETLLNTEADAAVRDLFAESGLEERLVTVLARDARSLEYVAFGGSVAGDEPAGRSWRHAEALVNHLSRSLAMSREFVHRKRIEHATMLVLDRLPYGVAILDSQGRALTKNVFACKLLNDHDGLTEGPEGFELYSNGDRMPLRRVLRRWQAESAWDDEDGFKGRSESFAVHRKDAERPLSVSIYPLPDGQAPTNCCALVLISDPEHPPLVNIEMLRRVLGLTKAEARLTDLLASGHRLADAAEMLNISVGTARTHLKHIFDKTGASSQADLVRIALNCSATLA